MTIPQRHIVKVHHAPARAAIDAVYELSYTDTRSSGYQSRSGRNRSWALDTKRVLSNGQILIPLAKGMVDIAHEIGVGQAVGFGYGSYLLLGAMAVSDPQLRVGVMRSAPKSYGFRRIVEGDLCRAAPMIIVDDIVNSSSTSMRVAHFLRHCHYHPTAVLVIFEFRWGGAEARLREHGLGLPALATLSRRDAFNCG